MRAVLAPDAGDLALLDDVDAQRVGPARITPGDGVVPGRAAAPLQRGPEHRIAGLRIQVEERDQGA